MADGIPHKPMKRVIVLLSAWACLAVQAGPLVSYSFDDDRLETGPDTFRIFEHSQGKARLNTEFSYSGFYSVEIRDVADDGDFPELQGYFPMQESGTLFVHFAFMTPNALAPFNIALAGPKRFKMQRDGIGFWLKNRQEHLYHVSDSMPKRLQPFRPFTWYLVDLTYRVEAGTYDLVIRDEYAEQPLVDIRHAANTTNAPHSKVNVFSFIGDLSDKADTVIYVDDIQIHSDRIEATEHLAPGRRKLFLDYWRDLERTARRRPQCIATTGLWDLDINAQDLSELSGTGALKRLEQILVSLDNAITPGLIEALPVNTKLRAVARWRLGCHLLERGEAASALKIFRKIEADVPDARIYQLSTTLALAALGRFNEVEERIGSIYGLWYGDERFAAAQAMIGLSRGDDWLSESVLQEVVAGLPRQLALPLVAELWGDGPDAQLVDRLRERYPDRWEGYLRNRLVLEQYYFLLLWRDRFYESLQFARQVAGTLNKNGSSTGIWYELVGNAALLYGDYQQALDYYERALDASDHDRARTHSVFLKLSDLFHLIGSPEKERHYREQVYGSLQAEEQPLSIGDL